MMKEELINSFIKIGRAFRLPGHFFSYEEIQTGNINSTYIVNSVINDDSGIAKLKPFLFQKVNTYAFKNPVQLMDNIEMVTSYIHSKRPESLNLHFHHTENVGVRQNYYCEGNDFWRVIKYIPSKTFMSCNDPMIIRGAGMAFGDFQQILSDFDASKLHVTIPNFHDTRKRYEQLRLSVKNDKAGRAEDIREELNYLLSVEDKACLLTDLQNKGDLQLRVTHNDTKINNVLFNPETYEPLVVVDLDTVMPGLVGNDFGDAIRSAANFVLEDSRDIEKAGIDLNILYAFADGFLSQTAHSLTKAEIETLGMSCFCIACELATRFLSDYLDGDKYFRTQYPEHNLVRARNQISLSKDMLDKMNAINGIIDGLVRKYRQ